MSTFMKLLGQAVAPTTGEIFVPSHLRVLHVSQEPVLLRGNIWRNVAIGRRIYWSDPEFETQRVVRICQRIGLSLPIIEVLVNSIEVFLSGRDMELQDRKWRQKISVSETNLIHLARAFIYNPEVLVLNRPTLALSEDSAGVVLELVREFVDKRGLE